MNSHGCRVCLGPLQIKGSKVHKRCLKQLFDTPRAPSIEIDPEQLHLFGLQMAGRVSVSGVQSKLALSLS
ncbi:MAG: hypothetical protein ACI8TQ_000343, partial [Planctomycetota bacterium]